MKGGEGNGMEQEKKGKSHACKSLNLGSCIGSTRNQQKRKQIEKLLIEKLAKFASGAVEVSTIWT
jgi:hypothetical protein